MSRDQVSGRKNSAILSMMVCRMESRLRDEVRAFATSLKMATSCNCFLRSGTAASLIRGHILGFLRGQKHGLCAVLYAVLFLISNHSIAGKPVSNNPKVT